MKITISGVLSCNCSDGYYLDSVSLLKLPIDVKGQNEMIIALMLAFEGNIF